MPLKKSVTTQQQVSSRALTSTLFAETLNVDFALVSWFLLARTKPIECSKSWWIPGMQNGEHHPSRSYHTVIVIVSYFSETKKCLHRASFLCPCRTLVHEVIGIPEVVQLTL